MLSNPGLSLGLCVVVPTPFDHVSIAVAVTARCAHQMQMCWPPVTRERYAVAVAAAGGGWGDAAASRAIASDSDCIVT